MNRFLKYFYYTTKSDKDIVIYRIVNDYSKEVVLLNNFANCHLEKPIFLKTECSTLWEELMIVFGQCQSSNATLIGQKNGKIVESNLKLLYADIVKLIKKHVEREIREVEALSNDKQVVCYRYISLDTKYTEVATPYLDYFCSGFNKSDEERFRLYIGSIFDTINNSKQMLFIYDPNGDGGKTSFINALMEYVGLKLCHAPSETALDSRFGLANLYNIKLLTISENKNPNILFTKMMMSILGGDMISAEIKGIQEPVQFYPVCKVIIASNDPLHTTGKHHHKTRLVICEIQKERTMKEPEGFKLPDGSYKYGQKEMFEIYKSEMPYFVNKCINLYNKHNRPAKVIDLEGQTELGQFLTDQNQIMTELFQEYFEYTTPKKTIDSLDGKVIKFLKREIHNNLKQDNILYKPTSTQIKSELGIQSKMVRGSEYLTNIKLKPEYTFENGEIVLNKYNKKKENNGEDEI